MPPRYAPLPSLSWPAGTLQHTHGRRAAGEKGSRQCSEGLLGEGRWAVEVREPAGSGPHGAAQGGARSSTVSASHARARRRRLRW